MPLYAARPAGDAVYFSAMTSPASRYFNLNGLTLHARDWGGKGTPLVLVHGLASNARIWDLVAPLLAKEHRVVALDQRSHGLSQPPADHNYTFDALCGDLHAVLEALQCPAPVVVGHSWGANVALEFAARYPGALRGALMLDGGMMTLGQRMTWAEAETRLAPPPLAGTPLEDFRRYIIEVAGDDFTEEIYEIVLGNFALHPDNTIAPHLAFDDHMRIVRAMWEEDAEHTLPKVSCPALFLLAEPPLPHDDDTAAFMQFRHDAVETTRRLMPHAVIEWLPDSIHDVQLQKPQLVAGRIARFAASL